MIGPFLRQLRVSNGLSQSTVAATTGISQPNLSAYESDRRMPTLDSLNKIAVACGYQLCATDGHRTIYLPLPQAGWFPDEDIPPADPGDPPDEGPGLDPSAPPEERAEVLASLLRLASATR